MYQILDSEWNVENAQDSRLIDVRYISGPIEGWQIFRVRSAVQDWIQNSTSNQLVFMAKAFTALSQPVSLRVSQRRDRHVNHQPVVILFNKDASSDLVTSEIETPSAEDPLIGTNFIAGKMQIFIVAVHNCCVRILSVHRFYDGDCLHSKLRTIFQSLLDKNI